jgi:hypothetical protein
MTTSDTAALLATLQPVALAAPQLVLRCVSDGRRIGVQLAYTDQVSRHLKAGGGSWHAARRMWVRYAANGLGVQEVLAWLREAHAGHWVDLDSGAALIEAALANPQPDFFCQQLDVQVFALSKGGLAVSAVFDEAVLSCLRRLHGCYHRHANAIEIQGGTLEQLLSALESEAGVASEFVFVHERAVVLEDFHASASAEVPISVPALVPERGKARADAGAVGAGFISTITADFSCRPVDEAKLTAAAAAAGLRGYQVEGVRYLLGRTSACLADDMGLGKTRQAVVACALAAGEKRILIACPSSLRLNWEREIKAVYPDAAVGLLGEDRLATLHGCQWVVANYERLGVLVKEPGLEFEVFAIDEAHYLKEHHAGRTRNAFLLAARIRCRYLITGTPLLNRELELHTLLRLSGHPLGALELAQFRKRYAGGPQQRANLAQALQGWMLRRSKGVLTDLGTKSRHLRMLSPEEGLSAYKAIWQDMTLMVMPKITKLRQCLEAMKFEFLIETVQGLGEHDKVIIFVQFIETAATLKNALTSVGIGCVSLIGADSSVKRQAAVDAFQTNTAVQVFITTTAAGGVGITLTKANWVIMATLPWTPAQMRQAEDRAYRLGQERDVQVLVPLIPGTIDEKVWQLLGSKTSVEEGVIEAVQCALEAA